MKAILMAAGRGSRISKHIPEIPKCTLDVGGKPLVRRTVEMLLAHNIEVTIIVGYKQENIREVLKDYPVTVVYNPFYDVTNSIASLWLARHQIPKEEDLILANADVFWSEEILDFILANPKKTFLLADKERVVDGDYFFATENGVVKKYGKDLKLEERTCEYVGIAKVDAGFVPAFAKRLEEMIGSGQHGVWWENVLYSLAEEQEIYAEDLEGRFWAEIDFIEDYQRILDFVAKSE